MPNNPGFEYPYVMSTQATLWHNPKCSTCRNALEALNQKGVELTLRIYLKQPPTLAELRVLGIQLGLRPIEFIRRKEEAFARLKRYGVYRERSHGVDHLNRCRSRHAGSTTGSKGLATAPRDQHVSGSDLRLHLTHRVQWPA